MGPCLSKHGYSDTGSQSDRNYMAAPTDAIRPNVLWQAVYVRLSIRHHIVERYAWAKVDPLHLRHGIHQRFLIIWVLIGLEAS